MRLSGFTIEQRSDVFVQLVVYLVSADAVVPIDPTVTQPCPTSALPLNIIADNCVLNLANAGPERQVDAHPLEAVGERPHAPTNK